MSFCPICSYEITESEDDERLCLTCGWYGDKSETKIASIRSPTHVAVELLDLYRSICRDEFAAELALLNGSVSVAEIKTIKADCRNARYAMVAKFVKGTQ